VTPTFPDPIKISAEDIARFRNSRVLWVEGEAGAPGLIPDGVEPDAHFGSMEDPAGLRAFERIYLAFALYAALPAGRYRLDPERLIGDHPALVDAALPESFHLTEEHRTLIRSAWWRMGVIDTKYPYGNYAYTEADIAGRLGHVVPLDDSGTFSLSPEREAHYMRLHHEIALALAVVLTEARLAPGTYRFPLDGWQTYSWFRLSPVDPALLLAYNTAWEAHAAAPSQPAWSAVYRASEALRL
jgi:hypothetical protein